MDDITVTDRGKRSPWLAALLSFIVVGLGQVYAGRLVRGLVYCLVFSLAIPVTILFLAYRGPVPTVPFGLLGAIVLLGLTLAAAVDAYLVAARTEPDYELKAYNHAIVYVLFGLLTLGSTIGYSLHIRSSLFEAFRVSAASMYPTIAVNDRILVDKTAYRKAVPQRGDIVLFHPPTRGWRSNYIKRIVALGGDTVSMRNGDLYVNGNRLSRERISTEAQRRPSAKTPQGEIFRESNEGMTYRIFLQTDRPQDRADFEDITIPEHHCFVMGDNRDESLDSRQFGPIPYAVIVGRADYAYWPAHDWSRFGRLD